MKKNSLFSMRLFKGVFVATCALFIQTAGYAQVYNPSATISTTTNPSSNYVGIGIATPVSKVHINRADFGTTELRVSNTQAVVGQYSSYWKGGTGGNIDSQTRLLLINPNAGTGFSNGFYLGLDQAYDVKSYTIGSKDATPLAFYTTGLERVRIDATGSVGIGTGLTTSPIGKLDINLGGTGNYAKISFNQIADHPSIRFYRGTGNGSTAFNWWIETDANGGMNFKNGDHAIAGSESVSTKISININGKVGIGTTLSTVPFGDPYKLYVTGGIRTEQVKVDIASTNNWADYVFKANYRLRPLSEVESFIKANSHLPEVPSADEVTKEGINLGEMDATLLKKIEELTLYMIEMKKENEAQSKQLLEMQQQNQQQASQLEQQAQQLKALQKK